MGQIITKPTVENLPIKFHSNNQKPSVKEAGPAIAREPNFIELHASFKIEYEQFLTDTSDEIAKRAHRLSKLKSIVYGERSS